MTNKQGKRLRNDKTVLIELTKTQKYAQPAKGWPMNEQKHLEILNECLLKKQKRKNMHNQLKDGQ